MNRSKVEHRVRIWPSLVSEYKKATEVGYHFEEIIDPQSGRSLKVPFGTQVVMTGEKKNHMIECVFFQVDEEDPIKLCKP